MTTFLKASLQPLRDVKGGAKDKPTAVERVGKPIPVQFNPTSLRLERRGNVDRGGVTVRSQRRQFPSQEAATLTVDLEFDTAEAGTTAEPADVRRETAKVRQFVEAPADRPTAAPPRVLFEWGAFQFAGIATQVTEELDYFAPNGTPLRAKVTLGIQEQNLEYERNKSGPGARDDGGATPPGGAGGAPDLGGFRDDRPAGSGLGASGTRDVREVAPALAGESAQQLLTRVGGDPGAWRAAMNDLPGPLALPAGTPVQLGPEVLAAGGVGLIDGFRAGGTVAGPDVLAAALAGAVADPAAAGFALAAAGGVAAAHGRLLAEQTATATGGARGSFAVPPAPASPVGVGGRAVPAGAADRVDPRALTYGRAVPLRARAHAPTIDAIDAGGRRALAARARRGEVPAAGAPGRAPWAQLPAVTPERMAADARQRERDARPTTMRWQPGGECR